MIACLPSPSLADNPQSQRTTAECDSTKIVGHFTLFFDGVNYDYNAGTSEWCYTLIWDGTPPELSNLTIQLCSLLTNSNLVRSIPSGATIGKDGSSGLYGIKWNNFSNYPANTPVTFCFTIDQLFVMGSNQFTPKAGVNATIVNICGPSIDCEDLCGVNNPPSIYGPADKTIFICDLPSTICVKPFAFSDPDNNIQYKNTNIGTLSGDSVCYTATTFNPDTIIVTVTDSCGATDNDTVIINKSLNNGFSPIGDVLSFCYRSTNVFPMDFDSEGFQFFSYANNPSDFVS